MKKYKAISPLKVTSGLVELSEKQAKRRARLIMPGNREGVYEIVKPVQFKAGEVFGLADVSKVHLAKLVHLPTEEEKQEAAKVAKEQAVAVEAKAKAQAKKRASNKRK